VLRWPTTEGNPVAADRASDQQRAGHIGLVCARVNPAAKNARMLLARRVLCPVRTVERCRLHLRIDIPYLWLAAPYSAADNLFRDTLSMDTPIAPRLLVDLSEAMRLLSIGKTKLNDLCNAGHLDRLKIGRRSVVTQDSILRFIARLKG
jgi:hypothetical protein